MRSILSTDRLLVRLAPALLPAVAAAGLVGLFACLSPPLASPTPVQRGENTCVFPQNVHDKADILFMIDNSGSMGAMQVELQSRFAQFFKPFQDLADAGVYANLHIGVVTSDYGAGASGAPGCTPSGLLGGGDRGRLQGIGAKADPSCRKPTGGNFIEYAFGPEGAAQSNLPTGQGLIDTFTCMASVGATGCGFEHQLESVHAALHDPIAENAGFLRDDALLMVVFLTNEDDGSAPPDSDVFDKNKTAQYGYEDSYSRQTRFAVMCGSPPAFPPYGDSNGALASCVPAPNPAGGGPGKQYDVQRYIDFFGQPARSGGVKDNPLDVMLIGIDAPEEPFQVLLSNPNSVGGNPYPLCGRLDELSNPPCIPQLQHSCVAPANPSFFGDPAVRLNAVIRSARLHAITSICESDYTAALRGAAGLILSGLGGQCIGGRFPVDPTTGAPQIDCNVIDETAEPDGAITKREMPRCDEQHATIPCFAIEPKAACASLSPNGVGLTIDRGTTGGRPSAAPAHTTAVLTCATLGGRCQGGSSPQP